MANNKYNLEERTSIFAENILSLVKLIKPSPINNPLISQLVRSGTSIGANYFEANGGSSKKDFANKIFICKKESKETMYWLRLIEKTNEEIQKECRILWHEAHELTLIFSKIASSTRNNKKLNIKN